MNFLADENVDQTVVDRLRVDGHDILSVAELDPSIPDEAVLRLASERQCLLLTADKDFGDLVFRQQRMNSGVVLFRLEGLSSLTKAAIVSAAVSEHSLELLDAFTVISPAIVRIRPRV